MADQRFTIREERANAISHLTGAVLATGGLVLMVVFSAIRADAWAVVSTAIFGSVMIMLYLSSTFTHWLSAGKAKELFFTFDQVAIFLMIAATYTPLALTVLRGPVGWVIFGLEWGLAVTGITIKLFRPSPFAKGVSTFYIVLYVLMGWLLLIAIVPLARNMHLMGLGWILTGGLFYTLGILFYKKSKFPYHHLVWHLMVIAGSISHFIAVFFYIINR
ncbi:MAG: hemolysin III family protein [Chlorobi bacterium]|nr:hemolysin III family protein [Chlorobiota bacterium]